MHDFHCEACDGIWTAGELVEDGQAFAVEGDWAEYWSCPNCHASNRVDGESTRDDHDNGGSACQACSQHISNEWFDYCDEVAGGYVLCPHCGEEA